MKLDAKAIQKIRDFGVSLKDFNKNISLASENLNRVTGNLNELKKNNQVEAFVFVDEKLANQIFKIQDNQKQIPKLG